MRCKTLWIKTELHKTFSHLKACYNTLLICLPLKTKAYFIFQEESTRNMMIGNNLINMYDRCGSLQDADIAFEKLKNVLSWNASITRLIEGNQSLMALSGEHLDRFTFIIIFGGCFEIASPQTKASCSTHTLYQRALDRHLIYAEGLLASACLLRIITGWTCLPVQACEFRTRDVFFIMYQQKPGAVTLR